MHEHQTKLFSATPADGIETFVSRLTHTENVARHRGLEHLARACDLGGAHAQVVHAHVVGVAVAAVGVVGDQDVGVLLDEDRG